MWWMEGGAAHYKLTKKKERGKKKKKKEKNFLSPTCHLHLTSNSPPRITSVTESGRMQLQVVFGAVVGRNKHLDSLRTTLVVFCYGESGL